LFEVLINITLLKRGETTLENAIKNVHIGLQLAGVEIPVYGGCVLPFQEKVWGDNLFGEDGLNG